MKTIQQIQGEVNDIVVGNVWKSIHDMGVSDFIYDVQMQGSYAKGTDLPEGGSDMDLFIIFNTSVGKDIREEYGLKIGVTALNNWNPAIKDATSKYVEAYFNYQGFDFEIQIVPIRHLTLKHIQSKELNGEPITIGMERTPHQTTFMIEALKGKTEEVRKLKQWMKDEGLYDSSMKSQGFSGYATECLIHYLGSFNAVINFFTSLKKGSVLGSGKAHTDNIFSIIDPIDSDRDLVSAFSDEKIVKTVRMCQRFNSSNDVIPYEPMTSSIIKFKVGEVDEDIIAGQVRKTVKSIVIQVRKMGFDIPFTHHEINDFAVNIDRTSFSIDGNDVTVEIGVTDFHIPSMYEDDGVPIKMEKAVNDYMKANKGCEFISKDGRMKAIKTRRFTMMGSAIKYVIEQGDVKKTNIIDDMRKCQIIKGESIFEKIV